MRQIRLNCQSYQLKKLRIGLPAVPELYLEVINLPDKLIFTAPRAGEPISGVNVKSNDLPDQDKDSILADQIGMASSGCRSKQDLPIRVFLLFFSISVFKKLAYLVVSAC